MLEMIEVTDARCLEIAEQLILKMGICDRLMDSAPLSR